MKTIFVADDDPLLREVLARTLHNNGFLVRAFPSADALLERFEFEYPQLIISDNQMPGMTGLELLEALRQTGSEVPFMLMSGDLTPEVESRATPLVVERLIRKPLSEMDRLIDAIRLAVGDEPTESSTRSLNGRRSNFLMNLAHELRTPLTAVKVALDNLFTQRAGALTPEERKMAEIGRRNVDRIITTVEHQLDLLHTELGELPVAEEPEKDSTTSKEDLEPVR